ncbi:MAG: ABC transporter permease [Proteobacteria bacterium]|nr:ABC transporter permease [Pseudomonadota bacterium]MBK7114898.1 ABC transporter permease [Pseudomonadota bacterium]MCC6631399.1 ABC transporter permease [Gammaproteobacteria bacterium]
MSISEYLKTAIIALRLNVLRSVLTTLGIIIGVASVIVMSAIGSGASKQIEDQISSLGTNQLTIFPGSANVGGRQGGFGSAPPLTEKDLRAVRDGVTGVMAASGNLNGNANVVIGNANWSTQVQGVGSEIEQVREWSVVKGRFFDAREAASGAKVAVLGDTVANELFGAGDPVGATVRINNAPFQVLGVLAKKGQAGGRDQDDVVMVPISTARSRLVGRLGAPDQIGSLLVKVDPRYNITEVQADIERVLRERRRIGADKDNNFIIRNFAEFLETRNQAAQTLGLLLAATAAISLVVGGIGIMNIMLVSVTERTREIGLRMAIGARGGDILGQFLTEAVLLCLVGGLIGLTLGAGVSFMVAKLLSWPMHISPVIVLVAIAASASVGVVFGFVPARRASRLNPIEALRYE